MNEQGIISAGHPLTARAGSQILAAGGNAFDAAVAAMLAACFSEPLLASIGGGGFMLAHTPERARLIDFFCQTPHKRKAEADLFPIEGNFGATTQEFHIGVGAIATPGFPAGLHAIHQHCCSMPLRELAQPALEMAAEGVPVNPFQAYVGQVLAPIVRATPEAQALFCSADGTPLSGGFVQRNPALADMIRELVARPPQWFYEDEPGRALVALCETKGGHLQHTDLKSYEVAIRDPLTLELRQGTLFTNPVPSCGGALIAFGMKLLEQHLPATCEPGSLDHARILTEVFDAMNRAREDSKIHLDPTTERCGTLLTHFVEEALKEMDNRLVNGRGTTHISVADRDGNLCALTLTNGEGCGHLLPATGVMLNNMLGEEDVNPHGLGIWPTNQRISSMMAPSTLVFSDGSGLALGTGGSNRIRTALIQVVAGTALLGLEVEAAVSMARLHLEGMRLNVEPGWSEAAVRWLADSYANHHVWDAHNLYFGGVHVAGRQAGGEWVGFGDPRRGGVCLKG